MDQSNAKGCLRECRALIRTGTGSPDYKHQGERPCSLYLFRDAGEQGFFFQPLNQQQEQQKSRDNEMSSFNFCLLNNR